VVSGIGVTVQVSVVDVSIARSARPITECGVRAAKRFTDLLAAKALHARFLNGPFSGLPSD
jgi:hypothetical protein